jgi:hypothetical protein
VKRNYKEIAATIKHNVPADLRREHAEAFADKLEFDELATCPLGEPLRFDRAQFLHDCGID